ncbi:hypothetical protein ACVWWI_003345 [Bradyrhizobium sp. USDA 3686]|uniref:hypothetical protein n=1 Tax=Bradyrhizobium canariense TaxID=255045 RepID=UPI00195CE186|nr:hypothetical protein [Bradyrhizobium canariense]MBM7483339.1 hypothetical protein [Bradyrhizobium canariense]
MTEFEQQCPNWREDVTGMCAAALMAVAEDENPLPWPEGFVCDLEASAAGFAAKIFEQFTQDRVVAFEVAQFVRSEIRRLVGAVNDMARVERTRRGLRPAVTGFEATGRNGEALN